MEILVELGIGRSRFENPRKAGGSRLASAVIWAGMVTASLFCQGCLVLPLRVPVLLHYGGKGDSSLPTLGGGLGGGFHAARAPVS